MQDRNLVLVVDDDPGMLKAVQRLLRQHAYEPIVFSSAQAFKSHADFEKAAAVILDINLPDGSGIELRQGLIPDLIDQNPCAHRRNPMDMIFQGRSMSVFQA